MTMTDETEAYRRERQAELNAAAADRARLETEYGKVYNTDELTVEYEVIGFSAPYAVVKRKSDGVRGSVEFQHRPRFYFNFVENK